LCRPAPGPGRRRRRRRWRRWKRRKFSLKNILFCFFNRKKTFLRFYINVIQLGPRFNAGEIFIDRSLFLFQPLQSKTKSYFLSKFPSPPPENVKMMKKRRSCFL
jgi:hypothetical protein